MKIIFKILYIHIDSSIVVCIARGFRIVNKAPEVGRPREGPLLPLHRPARQFFPPE